MILKCIWWTCWTAWLLAELVHASQTWLTWCTAVLRWTQSLSTLAFQQTLQRLTWNSRCLRATCYSLISQSFRHAEVGMDQNLWHFMIPYFGRAWIAIATSYFDSYPSLLLRGVARSCLEIVLPSPTLRLCELHFLGDSWFLMPGLSWELKWERASNGIWIGHDGLRRFKNLVQRFVELMRVCIVLLLSAERMCHAEQWTRIWFEDGLERAERNVLPTLNNLFLVRVKVFVTMQPTFRWGGGGWRDLSPFDNLT